MTAVDLAQVLNGWASVATAAIAVAAIVVAVKQLGANRDVQRETVAKTTYSDYLKRCLERPMLASGKIKKENAKPAEWEEYKWFVAYLIWAAEEVIAFAPNDRTWLNNIKLELSYHREFLLSDEFRSERPLYTDAILRIIDQVTQQNASSAARLGGSS